MEETKSHTGVTIEYDLSELPELTPQQEMTFYRALQEGLTNGLKHGKSTAFDFKMSANAHQITFDLFDNGNFSKPLTFGFGLSAMEKRVRTIGGTLTIGKRKDEQGAHLKIQCPLNLEKGRKGEALFI